MSKHNCSNKYKEYDYILHIKIIYEHIFHVFATTIVSRNVYKCILFQ